jgi:hypothetical protein
MEEAKQRRGRPAVPDELVQAAHDAPPKPRLRPEWNSAAKRQRLWVEWGALWAPASDAPPDDDDGLPGWWTRLSTKYARLTRKSATSTTSTTTSTTTSSTAIVVAEQPSSSTSVQLTVSRDWIESNAPELSGVRYGEAGTPDGNGAVRHALHARGVSHDQPVEVVDSVVHSAGPLERETSTARAARAHRRRQREKGAVRRLQAAVTAGADAAAIALTRAGERCASLLDGLLSWRATAEHGPTPPSPRVVELGVFEEGEEEGEDVGEVSEAGELGEASEETPEDWGDLFEGFADGGEHEDEGQPVEESHHHDHSADFFLAVLGGKATHGALPSPCPPPLIPPPLTLARRSQHSLSPLLPWQGSGNPPRRRRSYR